MSSGIAMRDETDARVATFGETTREHQTLMLVYARTLLRDEGRAREVVQDALVAAWQGMERFDVSRDAGSWLRGIVRNKWKDFCRRQGRSPEFTQEDLEYLEGRMEQLEQRPAIFDDLLECRKKLPPRMGEVIAMSYDEGLPSEVIGEKVGASGTAVRKRLERARLLLKDCLEGGTSL